MFKDKLAQARIDNLVTICGDQDVKIASLEGLVNNHSTWTGMVVSTIEKRIEALSYNLKNIPRIQLEEMIARQGHMSHEAVCLRLNALETTLNLLIGALGKELVEEPEVPAVPAVPARHVIRDLPKVNR